jgi:diguanylate cyclase (GGDEF)-like protein
MNRIFRSMHHAVIWSIIPVVAAIAVLSSGRAHRWFGWNWSAGSDVGSSIAHAVLVCFVQIAWLLYARLLGQFPSCPGYLRVRIAIVGLYMLSVSWAAFILSFFRAGEALERLVGFVQLGCIPAAVYAGTAGLRLCSGMMAQLRKEKEAKDKYYRLAVTDYLTGLPNRMCFEQCLRRLVRHETPKGEQIERFALMYLDLDDFKAVNDKLGHIAGDQLLQSVAVRLKHCVRKGDTVFRLSGDEFTVIMPNIHHYADTAEAAQRILDTIAQPFAVDRQSIAITASIGISLYPKDGDNPASLIRKADEALYRAKMQGGGVFSYCHSERRR